MENSTELEFIRHVVDDPAAKAEVRRRRLAAQDAGLHHYEHVDQISGPAYEPDQADGLVTYAVSANKKSAGVTPIPLWVTFPEFVEIWKDPLIVENKDDGVLFTGALFHGEELYRTQYGHRTNRCRRSTKNLRYVTIIGFDYDEGDVDLPTLLERLQQLGLQAFVYTTFSHTTGKPKLRILIPLRRPVDVSNLEQRMRWRLIYEAVALLIGAGAADPSCKDANRLFYPPMHKAGAPFECAYIDGAPLDADAVKVAPPAPSRVNKARPAAPDPVARKVVPRTSPRPFVADAEPRMAEVVAALKCIPACCSRKEWLTVLFALQAEWSDDAFDLFEAWSETCPEKFDEQDLSASWDATDPDGGTTMGSFWWLAQEYGFDREDYSRQRADALRKRLKKGQ